MPHLTFDEVYNKAVTNDRSDGSQKSALYVMWKQGIEKFVSLYGDEAYHVIRLCFDVSPRFCLHVVTVVYGMHWNFEDPNNYDKALITNAGLILSQNLKQFQVLMLTFLTSAQELGKNGVGMLLSIIQFMVHEGWVSSSTAEQAYKIVNEAPNRFGKYQPEQLDDHVYEVLRLAAMSTLCKSPKDVGLSGKLTQLQSVNLIFHLNTYIGCPRVWDASMEVNERM